MKKRYMSRSSLKTPSGDYNVECDRCGVWLAASLCKREWTKLFVCPECYEDRNVQDFPPPIRDNLKVPIPRPQEELPTATPVALDGIYD